MFAKLFTKFVCEKEYLVIKFQDYNYKESSFDNIIEKINITGNQKNHTNSYEEIEKNKMSSSDFNNNFNKNNSKNVIISFEDLEKKNKEIDYFKKFEIKNEEKSKENEQIKSIASIVHDLRTPLIGIDFMIEKAKIEKNSLKREKYLNFALNNSAMLMNLIHDILDSVQIKVNSIRLQINKFKIKNVLEDVHKLMSISAEMKGIKIILNNRIPKYKVMVSDERRLKQILINFISNAIKFTIEGIVILETSLDGNNNKFVNFSVTDTGLGMSEDIVLKLGQPFATFDNEKQVNKGGIGLGLNICKKLIGLLGPEENFKVSSKLNEGSTFSFALYKKMKKTNLKNIRNEVFREKTPMLKKKKKMTILGSNRKLNDLPLIRKRSNNPTIITNNSLDEQIKESNNTFFSSDDEISENMSIASKKYLKFSNYSFQNEFEDSSKHVRTKKNIKSKNSLKFSNLLHRLDSNNLFSKKIGPKFYKSENFIVSSTNSNQKKKFKIFNNEVKMLIVDDNMFNLFILEEILRKITKFQIKIIKTTNSPKALEIFEEINSILFPEKEAIKLIMLDLEMPGMSGYELCTQINEKIIEDRCHNSILIAYSSQIDQDVENKCIQAGFDEILEKPASIAEITELICDYFED